MKLLILFIAFLPCLWAAEVRKLVCPDGNECPFGKTCCSLPGGAFKCCDLPEDEALNKKLILGSPHSPASNRSSVSPLGVLSAYSMCPSYTTECGIYCCEYARADCCVNPMYCCPEGARCCSKTNTDQHWCCLNQHRCHTEYGYCKAGASSVSVTVLSLFLALLFIAALKY